MRNDVIEEDLAKVHERALHFLIQRCLFLKKEKLVKGERKSMHKNI